MRTIATIKTIIFITLVLAGFSYPEGDPYYYYHGQPYGSEGIFNPLTTIINGGFGILQISNRSNVLSDIRFKEGLKNVSYNLSHPVSAVSDYGWQKFISNEVLPTSIKRKKAQYFPNYSLHLIGGGATLRMFEEWYRWHHYPRPKAWAFGSWMIYHFLNEIVENNRYVGVNVDPISDMYVFNTLGAALFSFDGVNRFFGQRLLLRDWSFMPAYDPHNDTIENVGQNFVVKYRFPRSEKWSLIYHFGVHGAGGLSYRKSNGKSYSVAAGLVADELVAADEATTSRTLTTKLVWTAGMFYDKDNSLLASVILSGTKGYKVRLNVYPGLFKLGKFSSGFFVNLREDNKVVAGLFVNIFPLGVAGRSKM